MELREIIAKNICDLRVGAGLTQLGLAEILNYSDKAVSKWERAESTPDVFMLKRIADYFGAWAACSSPEMKSTSPSRYFPAARRYAACSPG